MVITVLDINRTNIELKVYFQAQECAFEIFYYQKLNI